MRDIVDYVVGRWPVLRRREVRRRVREIAKREADSGYVWSHEQRTFDTLLRTTQVYEEEFKAHARTARTGSPAMDE